jgi:hypothetical protein
VTVQVRRPSSWRVRVRSGATALALPSSSMWGLLPLLPGPGRRWHARQVVLQYVS